MTDAPTSGTPIKQILSEVETLLAANTSAFFELLMCIGGEDKRAAMEMLKPVSDNNNNALRTLTLTRAGQYAAAEDVILDARRAQLKDGKP